MIPTAILPGLIVGRWWIVPVVAFGWAILLLVTGTISASQIPEAAAFGAVNAAAGVLVHQVVALPFRCARRRRISKTQ